jgi:hypothetical protein
VIAKSAQLVFQHMCLLMLYAGSTGVFKLRREWTMWLDPSRLDSSTTTRLPAGGARGQGRVVAGSAHYVFSTCST